MKTRPAAILMFVVIAICCAAAFAEGNDYYVSPSGNDSDNGSQNRPWKTLHHAISQLNAETEGGSLTLHIADGTFSINESHSHESDDRLVISRTMTIVGHADSIIDGTGASFWKCGFEIEASDVVIRNLQIRGFKGTAGAGVKLISGSKNILEMSRIYDNQNGVVIQQTSQNNEIRNGCSFYHNVSSGLLIDSSFGNQVFGNQSGFFDNGTSGSAGTGIRLINGTSFNAILQNHIYSTANRDYPQAVGIDMASAGSGNRIAFNTVSRHSFAEQIAGTDHNGLGIRIRNSSPVIEQNFIIDNHKGIYITSGTALETSSPVIRNNQIYRNAAAGQEWGIFIKNNGGTAEPLIYHNTIDGGNNSGIEISGARPVIKYNIISNFKIGVLSDTSGLAIDYNALWNNSSSHYSGCEKGTHDSFQNPNYTGGSDYSLQPDSPCIDAIPLTELDPVSDDLLGRQRPLGRGFDMGCIETAKSGSYILNVQLAPKEGGTVSDQSHIVSCSGNLCTGNFSQNTTVTLTAVPKAGFTFERWEGDIFGTSNPITVTMNTSKTVKAVFSTTYTLSVQISGSGTVSVNGAACSNSCSYSLKSGAPVTLAAIPDQGFKFSRWEGDVSGTGVWTQLEMTGAKTVRAVFTQAVSLSLSASPSGRGSISVNDSVCENNCVRLFDQGSSVTLKAVPAPGFRFDKWQGDLTGSDNPAVVTLNSNKTITAVFISGYTLTTSVSGSGSITAVGITCPTDCSETYKSNESVTVNAIPSEGYKFDHWEGDLTGTSASSSIIMSQNRSVKAVFVKLPVYKLTATVLPSGSGYLSFSTITCSDTCSKDIPSGTTVTITAAPAEGYVFKGWSGSVSGTGLSQQIVMNADKSVTALFISVSSQKFTLTVSTGTDGGGTISAEGIACPNDCSEAYFDGMTVSLTAIPSEGYVFDRWEGDLTSSGNPAVLTMTSNKTVKPVFKIQTGKARLSISINPSGGGTVTGTGIQCPPDCTELVDVGTSIQLTASPSSGFRFNHWDTPPDLTFKGVSSHIFAINSNMEVRAFFAKLYNLPPAPPEPVRPADESVFSTGPVQVQISPFSDPEGDSHFQTRWRVRRADRTYHCPECDPTFNYSAASGTLTEHAIKGVYPGLKYAWTAGVTDSGSLSTSWTKEQFFKIGTQITDATLQIQKGTRMEDCRMASVHIWLNNPSSIKLFENTLKGYYDRNNFRIGSYDPIGGGYVEYGSTLKIEPGKAFWVLARTGMTVSASGVPVSLAHDIDVELKYQPVTGNGWNMISCPNYAQYLWKDIQLVVYAQNGTILFGPTAISSLNDANPYLDKRLWRWEKGAYQSDTVQLQMYSGYWVKARSQGVYLRFPVSAQNKTAQNNLFTDQAVVSPLQKAAALLSPISAAADSGEYPPMPIDGFSDASEEAGDTNVNCFINVIQK